MEEREVRCVDCGYLARRARKAGQVRQHEGYHEAPVEFRQAPRAYFVFIPGETNSQHQGELACYRHATNLPEEIADERKRLGFLLDENPPAEGMDETREVLNRLRQCVRFFPYEPGLSPPEHLIEQKENALENDRRTFERALAEFQANIGERDTRQNKFLSLLAICVGGVLGLIQLWVAGMAMSSEAFGAGFGQWVVEVTNAVKAWLLSLN